MRRQAAHGLSGIGQTMIASTDGPAGLGEAERREALQVLSRAGWFRQCPAATLELLLHGARLRAYDAGSTVVHRGEPVDRVAVVLSGSLEMSSTTAAGRRFVIAYMAPGELLGIIPLIDGRGAIYDTVAHEPSRVLTLADHAFRAAVDADAELRWRVMRALVGRARRLHASLTDTSVLPVPVRLARVLLSLRAAYGIEGDAIALQVSQEGLAAMLGVPRQRINAELKALERDGVLRMAYRRIALLDEQALRERAQEPMG